MSENSQLNAANEDPKSIDREDVEWDYLQELEFEPYKFQEEAIEASKDKKVETIRNKSPRVGRNDPCPCGSGKKYKHCCGRE